MSERMTVNDEEAEYLRRSRAFNQARRELDAALAAVADERERHREASEVNQARLHAANEALREARTAVQSALPIIGTEPETDVDKVLADS